MLILTSSKIAEFKLIKHGFLTKLGLGNDATIFPNDNGKSLAITDHSLAEEQEKLVNAVNQNIILLKQVHSNRVVVAESLDAAQKLQEADALVTTIPEVPIGVLTADCVPILLCDSEQKVVAAVHAGWRGVFSNIIENAVSQMYKLGATKIYAAIGPCIRALNYEVNQDFYDNAIISAQNSLDFFTIGHRAGHYQFNLPGYCAHILLKTHVEVDDLCVDTYSNSQLFYSHRRTYHENNGKNIRRGNQISFIMING